MEKDRELMMRARPGLEQGTVDGKVSAYVSARFFPVFSLDRTVDAVDAVLDLHNVLDLLRDHSYPVSDRVEVAHLARERIGQFASLVDLLSQHFHLLVHWLQLRSLVPSDASVSKCGKEEKKSERRTG